MDHYSQKCRDGKPLVVRPLKKHFIIICDFPKWRRYLTFQPLEKKKRYRSLSYKKLHKILPKGSIYGEFLRKLQKVKVEVTGPIKKHNFLKISELCTKTMFSDPVT